MCVRAHQNAPETKPAVDEEGITSAIYKLVCLLLFRDPDRYFSAVKRIITGMLKGGNTNSHEDE